MVENRNISGQHTCYDVFFHILCYNNRKLLRRIFHAADGYKDKAVSSANFKAEGRTRCIDGQQ